MSGLVHAVVYAAIGLGGLLAYVGFGVLVGWLLRGGGERP